MRRMFLLAIDHPDGRSDAAGRSQDGQRGLNTCLSSQASERSVRTPIDIAHECRKLIDKKTLIADRAILIQQIGSDSHQRIDTHTFGDQMTTWRVPGVS